LQELFSVCNILFIASCLTDRITVFECAISTSVVLHRLRTPELCEMGKDSEGHYNPDPTEKIDVFF
jgi:hypothetical protein